MTQKLKTPHLLRHSICLNSMKYKPEEELFLVIIVLWHKQTMTMILKKGLDGRQLHFDIKGLIHVNN